jgi:hypothetical protein
VLVSVTFLALLVVKTTWVEKMRLVGESVTAGKTPTPLSGSDCGLPGALSVMLKSVLSATVLALSSEAPKSTCFDYPLPTVSAVVVHHFNPLLRPQVC